MTLLFFSFHVWDLSAGDFFPVISIPNGELISGKINDFEISSHSSINDGFPVSVVNN